MWPLQRTLLNVCVLQGRFGAITLPPRTERSLHHYPPCPPLWFAPIDPLAMATTTTTTAASCCQPGDGNHVESGRILLATMQIAIVEERAVANHVECRNVSDGAAEVSLVLLHLIDLGCVAFSNRTATYL